ncbi:MAG: PBP1A family penicillin-binding protein [Fibrobacter sp.]|nr:PBP1A family penicillin-binding protein [Fibrobacter sp.]
MNKFKTSLFAFLRVLKSWVTDKKVLFWLAILEIPVILAVIAAVVVYSHYAPELPSLAQLEQINPKLVTKIYDMNGEVAHEYFVERREWTPYEAIPENAIHAVMATEDREFFDHWGMNVWAIPSAILESATSGKKMRGASTLTQQLTKLLFLTPERSISRKIKEAMTAIRIEQTYTKEEILEFYMNEVYLAAGNYGFQAAGKYYFGKPLDSLSIPELAVLAGMLQRPEGWRPDKNPKDSKARRNTVLYAMRDAGYITDEEYHRYIEEPIVLAPRQVEAGAGLYFYEEIRKYMEKRYGENSLYADGVTINSTIDPAIQAFADSVAVVQVNKVRRRIKQRFNRKFGMAKKFDMVDDSVLVHFDSLFAIVRKDYEAKHGKMPDSLVYHEAEIAAILVENETGAIRAEVGGSDWNKSRWNRARQSLRQPGSSFKPIVYSTAISSGASPCDSVNDAPITIEDQDKVVDGKVEKQTWRPANFEHDFEGMMTLRRALYRSKNLPAILTAQKYGLNNVVNYARKFGIQKAPLQAVPSMALGSIGATLMEMTSAYTVFPNGGNRLEPYMIESIVDKHGEVIEKNSKVEHEVLNPAAAYIMIDMLKDVNLRGTGAKVWSSGFRHPSGGKTGTSNDYADALYIGFTKRYTMGVWVGFDTPQSMGPGHTGGEDALPVWIAVMKELHKELPMEGFKMPPGVIGRGVCNVTGKAAGEFCSEKTYCLYTSAAPTEKCDGNHYEVRTKSADDATLFSKGNSAPPATGASKARKMF